MPDEVSSGTSTTTAGGGASVADPYVHLSATKVPNQKAVANVGSLPLGALVSPFAADAGTVTLRRDPARCTRCLAFISGFCKVDGRDGSWSCCFCGGDNQDALLAVGAGGDLQSYPELVMSSVDYHLTAGGLGTAASYGGSSNNGGGKDGEREPTPVVFLVDECLDDDEVAALRASMLEVVRGLPGSTKVGIATYAASVAVYDLSVTSGMASAEVVPGTRSPTPADLHSLLYGAGTFLAPLSSCMAAVEAVIGSLRPAASAAGPVHARPRCLGPALETAAALLKRGGGVPGAEGSSGGGAMEVGGGRVLVCTGGPATRGPGGIAVDEESELYDFEEQAAKTYIDELSTTVRYFCMKTFPPSPYWEVKQN
jgi:protein transport protein SEC23